MNSTRQLISAAQGSAVDRARPALLRAADIIGRLTHDGRALPGLLICGGQRCGTTSMYKALLQHPTIFRPVWRKGVHHFDEGHRGDVADYRAHFPLQSHLDRAEHRHGTRALCFESSPYYLFHPLAATRIAHVLPDVKLLVLVRDPVERAYSAHAHELARGYEDLPFREALAAEPWRLDGEEERLLRDPTAESHAHRHQAYRSRGEYADQLDRISPLFNPDQIKVVDSHRFFTDPVPVFEEVLNWIGVRPLGTPRFERHNARPRQDLPTDLRDELTEHFAPHDEALTLWLGETPSWRSGRP
ncbi:hypothetical protein BJ980_003189 [Nocardioides daedukensis]|uniref:Sulfotransferase domain-containing protein n=1 Tax=Nocardioides daedukensis TaxID=634462 RepID=A0A7Y9URW0_9ACTN|nr:sulfotransferase [Nocardioides daedukensis]NYG60266.1 hypothetical protein [Nocardioides daedukensis]